MPKKKRERERHTRKQRKRERKNPSHFFSVEIKRQFNKLGFSHLLI